MESTLKKNGVTISKFLFLLRGRFQPNCGRMAAQAKLKLRSTSTPATAAAAAGSHISKRNLDKYINVKTS